MIMGNLWQSDKRTVGKMSSIMGVIVIILISINFCINLRSKIIIEKYIILNESIEKDGNYELLQQADIDERCSDIISEKNKVCLISDIVVYSFVIISTLFFRHNRIKQDERLEFQNDITNILSNETENVFIFRDVYNRKNEFVSSNASKILGLNSDALLKNPRLFYERIISEDRKQIEEYENSDDNYGKEYVFKFEYYHPELNEIRNMLLKSYFIFARGFMPCYVYILEDLTDIVESNKKLEMKVKKSQNESKAKSDYLSSMSHDLRTPVHGISGMASLALYNINDKEKVLEYLNKISFSSNHLMSLINEVLDMSKIEQRKLTLKEEKKDIENFVNKISKAIKPRCEEKNIEFESNIHNIQKQNIYCDTVRLSQVLLNVINNAIKYTPEDGKISVDVYDRDSKFEGFVEYIFKVTDTGIGMSEEFINHIYEPFAREKNDNTENIEGSGLGMAITKGLVEIMNGDISIKSEVGKGTCIRIYINLKKYDKEDYDDDNENNNDVEKGVRDNQDKYADIRALVVDDQDINIVIAKGFLEKIGAKTECYLSSAEAYEKLKSCADNYFDVVFMDIQMPELNGYELTKLIRNSKREDLKEIPIFAMTADGFSEDIMKAKKAGMNGHISKPFDIEDLYIVLDNLLEDNVKK